MRRFALRDLRSDEGLGLIETVVALFVFSLIMTGLAASMAMFAHSTTLAHARATASTIAQQYTEKARAVGATNLENCNTASGKSAPPGNGTQQIPYRGDSGHYPVVGADAYCIPYSSTVTQDGVSYTLVRQVLIRNQGNDLSGQAINEKYLVVQVSWTDGGGAAKTYELDTIFTQKGSIPVAPAQGIRFVINDINGNILTADAMSWAVSIVDKATGSTLYTSPDATTAEGTYNQVDLSPGTYTCTAKTTTDASSSYFPGAQPTYNNGPNMTIPATNDTVTGDCTVTTSTVTDFATTWQSSKDCATSSTAKGTVNFIVTDKSTGANLSNQKVVWTQLNNGAVTGNKTTGSNGQTGNQQLLANWWTYTVTDLSSVGYTPEQNTYGPICIVAGQTYPTQTVKMVPPACSTSGTNNTVNITVQDAITPATKINGAKVSLFNATTGAVTAFPNANASGVSSKAMAPGSYYWDAGPTATSTTYQGTGLQGPICIAAGGTTNLTANLSAPGACTRTSGGAGKGTSTTVNVKNAAGANVSGATVVAVSVDGDALPGAQTTDASGNYTFTGAKALQSGPWQWFVTGTSYNPNWVLSPTFCVTPAATQTVPSLTLQGTFSVSVTLQNNDVVAWKNYTINVYDSSGSGTPVATQFVSVPNCTPGSSGCSRNPSAAITFSGLTTGSYYVQVCAQLSNGNCNLVDTAPTQSGGTITYYSFLTPGGSYTSATTGYGDLAATDDSGGA